MHARDGCSIAGAARQGKEVDAPLLPERGMDVPGRPAQAQVRRGAWMLHVTGYVEAPHTTRDAAYLGDGRSIDGEAKCWRAHL